MRCFEVHFASQAALQRSFPASNANAPFIAGFEAGKIKFGPRRHEIVSIEHGEIKKVLIELNANRVLANVFRTRATIAIAVKPGKWLTTTALQFGP